jgi:hypothetical protein
VGQSFLGHGAHEVACALVDSGERVVVAVVVVVVVVGGGGGRGGGGQMLKEG